MTSDEIKIGDVVAFRKQQTCETQIGRVCDIHRLRNGEVKYHLGNNRWVGQQWTATCINPHYRVDAIDWPVTIYCATYEQALRASSQSPNATIEQIYFDNKYQIPFDGIRRRI